MKLRILLSVLVFSMVGVACGKRIENVVGQQGEKGDTGEAGSDGVGCDEDAFGPSEEYPNGGITITCGDDDPIVLKNGSDTPRYHKPKKPKKD